ncbi:hypothetical protein M514_27203 [Trichuris suis]|uniref:Uncharacterized protein n=1 Tax=Trichuris suis TaxID=68888 RepID=A0A085MTT4_9BILA|nr:hypothetical protein M514_27203 [Trichuris suis]
MILAQGARGPEFSSPLTPVIVLLHISLILKQNHTQMVLRTCEYSTVVLEVQEKKRNIKVLETCAGKAPVDHRAAEKFVEEFTKSLLMRS